ncbi:MULTISPECIES: sensor histidine kinase [Shewanella]|uniref:histidine kinase n=1 Tax=Shewanella loihica (strain ATCC BAA-1088 / PV-4) TaxID=323850 RepID=A3Q922_SHELP|nr:MULTISPECIES: HAMP domain-containing sensor histidine kinase [Shewanella]ABO21970.1 integral membrane sensor signal transduction histidine kinase [Shewanella loihica PV-4]QYJ82554.1 HAMP domain-containing histidine kinase [Shewanella aegiceratis]QYJ93922.1 HAMP domain-containing histidine kinase [Shewanella spartinae]QYJ97776.1 HAMP domain-containing histidine kinase [Shewanella alkalitolerans]QYK14826.1 HAMP domain-containing histidine kinase [Shewanella rhizosphaerae]
MTLIIGTLLFGMYRQLINEQELQTNQHLAAEKLRYQQMALTLDRRSFATQIRTADPKTALVVWRSSLDLVGALSLMPDDMPLLPETRDFPILTSGPDKLHILTGGLVITRYGPVLIATRTDQLATLIERFVNAAITALMLTIVLTLALGYLFSKAILRRLVQYNRLSRRIERGEYSTRLPVSWRQDEFDMLAGNFNQVLDTLEANLHAVRGATDNIAHDLRTPLSHLRIGLEQLPQRPAEELDEASAILIEELDHCLATFDAMLSLTRIEEGQQDLELQPLSLNDLCQDLFEMAEAMAESNGQTLSLSLDQDYSVMGDKYLLFQALFNLVDNAIKYSGEGAKIEIIQQGNEILIRDNGPGIPDDATEKVFDRLVRLDPSRHNKGTGLGLSLVKAILQRHNARIELSDNQPGLQVSIRFS